MSGKKVFIKKFITGLLITSIALLVSGAFLTVVVSPVAAQASREQIHINQEETTDTPVPPTDTPVSPTDTPVPPTDTPVPPTDTPVSPTDTPVPPTSTPVTPTDTPTETEVPPTETPLPPTPETPTPVPPTSAPVIPPRQPESPSLGLASDCNSNGELVWTVTNPNNSDFAYDFFTVDGGGHQGGGSIAPGKHQLTTTGVGTHTLALYWGEGKSTSITAGMDVCPLAIPVTGGGVLIPVTGADDTARLLFGSVFGSLAALGLGLIGFSLFKLLKH